MSKRKILFDIFSGRFEELDAKSRKAGLSLLLKECLFFETVFNAVEDGILVIDRELKMKYFNRTARELLALPEDISEVRLSQLLPDFDWQRLLGSSGDGWKQVVRQELQICYPAQRFLQFYLVPISGDEDLAVVILHDITESRRQACNDLERETAKAVSSLAAGVAHEIGNPLNSLYLNLQLLERGISGDDSDLQPDEMREMLACCKSEVERLDSIIHSFLTAVRPGSNKFTRVDLRVVVLAVLNFMRPEIMARKISVSCDWQAEFLPVFGNEEQLKQVFYNIIRNAAQAMSNGGTLLIRGYAEHDSRILEFVDSGHGMTPDELYEMFVPFKTHKAGGSGIGTMIIERVCREHGVDFGVVTTEGRGTVFQLKFPDGKRRVRLLGGTAAE